jgi:dTDP-4-amino-4,6-dideoxygalactose transaminase
LRIFNRYNELFLKYDWAIFPPGSDDIRTTSAHLYMLRIIGITEAERDEMIVYISHQGVSVNVHFIPMPMMTLFKRLGYVINDYANAYKQYSCEISLPIYPQLTNEQVNRVVNTVADAYYKIKG